MEAEQTLAQRRAYVLAGALAVVHLRHLGGIGEHGLHGGLVERPGIDVGVDIIVGGSAEKPCLAELPIAAGLDPGLARAAHLRLGEPGGTGLAHGVADVGQAHRGVGQAAVGGHHSIVDIVGHDSLQGGFLGIEGSGAAAVAVVVGACAQRERCRGKQDSVDFFHIPIFY